MKKSDSTPSPLPRDRRSVRAAIGCALAAFVAALPFPYVGSFIAFVIAYPYLHPDTCRTIEPFYTPLIWLCLQGETVQGWILEWPQQA